MLIKLFLLIRSFSNSNSREMHKRQSVCHKRGEISSEQMVVKRKTFPKNVIISVGFSKLGRTSVLFVESGVEINGQMKYWHLCFLK